MTFREEWDRAAGFWAKFRVFLREHPLKVFWLTLVLGPGLLGDLLRPWHNGAALLRWLF